MKKKENIKIWVVKVRGKRSHFRNQPEAKLGKLLLPGYGFVRQVPAYGRGRIDRENCV